jgi:MFS family permease
LVCLGFFVVGLLVCALATSFPLLLTGRALTGVSGGLFPLAFGLVRSAVPAERLPGTIAVLSAMFGIGGAAGMLAAGPLLDTFNTDALVGLLLGVSQTRSWGAGPAVAVFAATAVIFADFAVIEQRLRQPLVDVRLLSGRAMAVTNLTTVVIGAAMFGAVTLIPLLVPENRIAVALAPMVAAMLVATPLAPRLSMDQRPRQRHSLPLRCLHRAEVLGGPPESHLLLRLSDGPSAGPWTPRLPFGFALQQKPRSPSLCLRSIKFA